VEWSDLEQIDSSLYKIVVQKNGFEDRYQGKSESTTSSSGEFCMQLTFFETNGFDSLKGGVRHSKGRQQAVVNVNQLLEKGSKLYFLERLVTFLNRIQIPNL
jgi:hypothetical protein